MGMFSLIDSYASSWGLLICAITEVVLVMWIYGFKRFFKNIEEMGIKIPIVLKGYWTIMWVIITPLILLLVLIMTFVHYSPASAPSYTQEKYIFPGKIQAMGWLMALAPVAFIIIGAVYAWVKRSQSGRPTDLRSMISPMTSGVHQWKMLTRADLALQMCLTSKTVTPSSIKQQHF